MHFEVLQSETLPVAIGASEESHGLHEHDQLDKKAGSRAYGMEQISSADQETLVCKRIGWPPSPSFLPPLTPTFPPVSPSLESIGSPSYNPLSPYSDTSSPIVLNFDSKVDAHISHPTYPSTGRTYAAALKVLKSDLDQNYAAGRIKTNITSPINQRSDVKVFGKPMYTKKPARMPENNTNAALKLSSSESGIRLKINFKKDSERITVMKNSRNDTVAANSNDHKRKTADMVTNNSDFTDSEIERITAKKKSRNNTGVTPINNQASSGYKRSTNEAIAHGSDFTDSDIDLSTAPRKKKTVTSALPLTAKMSITTKRPKKSNTMKKAQQRNIRNTKGTATMSDSMGDSITFDDDDLKAPEISLVQPTMKRKDRIVDPSKPEDAALIAAATKAGAGIYDSDLEDLPNAELKGVKKRELFRNVKWGSAATDFANNDFSKNLAFTQFVPGRWERQLDGTVVDQKHKLLVKLTDHSGEKRIFANPPPADWSNQEALTILNKRTVQQIRRNTETRFRKVVVPYVLEERRWIVANLQQGKPVGTWEAFVDAFNERFEGVVVAGALEPRSARTISSLCKEVERFGAKYYSKGLVPLAVKKEAGEVAMIP
jgi:hypothetical protein